jgi:hypothetical protein
VWRQAEWGKFQGISEREWQQQCPSVKKSK